MKIIAGIAKGRRLAVPARGTRPTSDRAREALFNTLAGLLDLAGARLLDLFAGTGAVGLEALSRGAAHVTFVESDRSAVQILARNIATVGLPSTSVLRCTAESFLATTGSEEPFGLVFADPPYTYGEASLAALLDGVSGERWMGPDGIIVVERSVRSCEPHWPDVIEPIKRRRYGEGVLWYGRRL